MTAVSRDPHVKQASSLLKSHPGIRSVLTVFAICLTGFLVMWLVSARPGTQALSSNALAANASLEWVEVKKTDYTNNRTIGLKKGATGHIILPKTASVVEVSFFTFDFQKQNGSAELTMLGADGADLATLIIDASSPPRRRYVDLDAAGQEATSLRVRNMGMQYTVIDRIVINPSNRGNPLGVLIYALPLIALLTLSIWMAQRFSIAPETSSKKSWAYIDELRGVAILLVLFLHICGSSGLPSFAGVPSFRKFAYNGHYGVELFYLVSAFTLTLSIMFARTRGPLDYKTFIHNRVLRIVPVFLVVFAVCMIFRSNIVLALRDLGLSDITRNLFLVHIFDNESLRNPIGHSVWWSIATEFQFYVLMPFILIGALSLTRQRLLPAIGIIVVASFALSMWAAVVLAGRPWVRMSVLYHIDAFAIGMALGLLFDQQAKHRLPENKELLGKVRLRLKILENPSKLNIMVASILVWGFLIAVLSLPMGSWVNNLVPSDTNFSGRIERTLVLGAGAGVIGLLFLIRDINRERGGLAYIGILSYVIYLVHIPVLRMVSKLPYPKNMATEELYYIYLLILTLAVSVFVSLFVHCFIEAPVLSRFKGARAGKLAPSISMLYAVIFSVFTVGYVILL